MVREVVMRRFNDEHLDVMENDLDRSSRLY